MKEKHIEDLGGLRKGVSSEIDVDRIMDGSRHSKDTVGTFSRNAQSDPAVKIKDLPLL